MILTDLYTAVQPQLLLDTMLAFVPVEKNLFLMKHDYASFLNAALNGGLVRRISFPRPGARRSGPKLDVFIDQAEQSLEKRVKSDLKLNDALSSLILLKRCKDNGIVRIVDSHNSSHELMLWLPDSNLIGIQLDTKTHPIRRAPEKFGARMSQDTSGPGGRLLMIPKQRWDALARVKIPSTILDRFGPHSIELGIRDSWIEAMSLMITSDAVITSSNDQYLKWIGKYSSENCVISNPAYLKNLRGTVRGYSTNFTVSEALALIDHAPLQEKILKLSKRSDLKRSVRNDGLGFLIGLALGPYAGVVSISAFIYKGAKFLREIWKG